MKIRRVLAMGAALSSAVLTACGLRPAMVPNDLPADATNVLYLHHSVGKDVWDGGIPPWFKNYNRKNGTKYNLVSRHFPYAPYPENENDPYDYWRLWVEHSGSNTYAEQPTLETLTRAYDVIVWKNCFLAGDLSADASTADVASPEKTVANHRLQYEALKVKMHEFPNTKFLVWTVPPKVQGGTNPEMAQRAQEFADWVRDTWDEPGDNIYLWDYRTLASKGGIYLLDEYAVGPQDSHPNRSFAKQVAPLFSQRLVDVIEGRGDKEPMTGAVS
jgi:hypothetical protein